MDWILIALITAHAICSVTLIGLWVLMIKVLLIDDPQSEYELEEVNV